MPLYLLLLAAMLAGELWSAQPVRSRQAMVVSGDATATETGLAVLKAGGNAIDAATAMAFTLGVTHSAMTGLGGGGQVVIRMNDGRTAFLDFREQAPGKSSRDMFLDAQGNLSPDAVTGWRAAAVPGYVKGWETTHRRFGRKLWKELLDPAIRLASQGFALSWLSANGLRSVQSLAADPESKRIFLNGGRFFEAGGKLVQPELARTLTRVANGGAEEFYEGETARRFAEAAAAHGSLLTLADLKVYTVAEAGPLVGAYRGYSILTAGGSSAGGVGLLQMLAVLEGSGFEKYGANSAGAIHYMAEAMRRYFADRSDAIGDPAFVQVPYDNLLSKRHIESLRASIDPRHATPSDKLRQDKIEIREGKDTTHFAVLDAAGNAIAATVTLNSAYGSGVTVPGLGFLLNNNMDNFAANPGKTNHYGLVQGDANAIQPGKRPVSSMTPAILLKDGTLFMIVGTPGGPTILNSVMQAVVNVIDFHMNAQDAVNAPRVHHQWYPDKLIMEPGFSPDTIVLLKERGHEIEFRQSNNDLNMILVDGGWIQGAVDVRREGKAAGF